MYISVRFSCVCKGDKHVFTANWGTCAWDGLCTIGIVPAMVVGRNHMTLLNNEGTSGMEDIGMSEHGQQCTK